MKVRSLPPAPLNVTCPLWLLVEWAEVFRPGLRSRSKVVLEIGPRHGPSATGERWLALVTWCHPAAPLLRALPVALRRECRRVGAAPLMRATMGSLFRLMAERNATVWSVSLSRWGGAAIFVRRPANDAPAAALAGFNRAGPSSRPWRPARPRTYPKAYREEYARAFSASSARESVTRAAVRSTPPP